MPLESGACVHPPMGKGFFADQASEPNLSGNPVRVDDRGGGATFCLRSLEKSSRVSA